MTPEELAETPYGKKLFATLNQIQTMYLDLVSSLVEQEPNNADAPKDVFILIVGAMARILIDCAAQVTKDPFVFVVMGVKLSKETDIVIRELIKRHISKQSNSELCDFMLDLLEMRKKKAAEQPKET